MRYIHYAQLSDCERLELVQRPAVKLGQQIQARLAEIKQSILHHGDAALFELTMRFDGVQLNAENLCIADKFCLEAWESLDVKLQDALQVALRNIAKFHKTEFKTCNENHENHKEKVETSSGVFCWREFRAIESVGLYIPGGSAPLFSTMLMLGIPAILAGCKQLVFCSPPSTRVGKDPLKEVYISQEMLACKALLQTFAAQQAGSDSTDIAFYQVGGAQAIFAMAYGSCSLPQVHKIFGPGNSYVTGAKLMVTDSVAIDMPAGPSEVLVIAEAGQNPAVIAADLLAQAEHGPSSQVLLLSPSKKLLHSVEQEIASKLQSLERRSEIELTLANSYLIETSNLGEAVAISNSYAPEHLILAVEGYAALLSSVMNAGSVFCGPYASESFGDYASGTNHTLPTGGFAKSMAGVNTQSFGRWLTFQEVTPQGLRELGPTVELLAQTKGLTAHKDAVAERLKSLP